MEATVKTTARPIMTVSEAADYLRVSVRTMRTLISENKISYSKDTGKILIRVEALDEYVSRTEVRAAHLIEQEAINKTQTHRKAS